MLYHESRIDMSPYPKWLYGYYTSIKKTIRYYEVGRTIEYGNTAANTGSYWPTGAPLVNGDSG
jgi:hypothetical protein